MRLPNNFPEGYSPWLGLREGELGEPSRYPGVAARRECNWVDFRGYLRVSCKFGTRWRS